MTAPNAPPTGDIKTMYERLEPGREPYLHRARALARLTIPYLFPEENESEFRGGDEMVKPYQSIGARGVKHLASKLLLVLLPPDGQFFRLKLDEALRQELDAGASEAGMSLTAELESSLTDLEKLIAFEIDGSTLRVELNQCLEQLVGPSGNALLHVGKERSRMYRLDSYVIQRDPEGTVVQLATKESLAPEALPKRVREIIDPHELAALEEGAPNAQRPTVDIYTGVWLNGTDGQYYSRQEVLGKVVPGTTAHWPPENLPWRALRFTAIAGESYGRSFSEAWWGDLQVVENGNKALTEAAAAAGLIMFFVKPNGFTQKKDVIAAARKNGGFVDGHADDVTTLTIDKQGDLQTVMAQLNDARQRLEQAYLLHSSVQRHAERVTAEEIRLMAQELETALGGVYSLLALEVQLPIINLMMNRLRQQGKIKTLDKKVIRPVIITGLEALSRGYDLQKLDVALAGVSQVLGPEAVATWVNAGEYIKRRFAALGVDSAKLVRTEEEVQQQQQQAQMQQMTSDLGPAAIGAVSDAVTAQGEPTE